MKDLLQKISTTTQGKLQDKTFVFRLIVTIIAIDFVAFITLGSINPVQLLNPTRFLWSAPTDKRQTVDLFFPKSFDIEKISQRQSEESGELEESIIKVKQKMYLPAAKEVVTASSDVAAQAGQIIHELILGPQDLQAKKFIKEKHFIKNIWFGDGRLALSVNYTTWFKLNERTRKLAQFCVEKSLRANLKQINSIQWDI